MSEMVPYEEVEGERLYRVEYMAGVTVLKRPEHVLTWLDHERFEEHSEIMTVSACAEDLGMIILYMQPLTFANERPPAPSLWQRVLAALTTSPSTATPLPREP
jgi:hypothetical protein